MVVLAAGCGGTATPPAKPLSRDQRDSAIGASAVIPGAAGVRGARRLADTARARNALRDSLAAAP